MNVVWYIILFLTLALVAWQDFKSRSIYWWLPVLISISGFFIAHERLETATVFTQILLNLFFSLLILSVVVLYVFIRYRTLKAFTSERFGLGDILMLLAVCPLFPLVSFVVFLCLSNLLILLIELILRITVRQNVRSIPYAGYLSVFLMILTVCGFFIPDINFQSDIAGYFLFSGN